MRCNTIKKILTIFTLVLGCLSVFEAVCFVGAGGILNDLDAALKEVEVFENQDSLETSSVSLSENAQWTLDQYHDAAGIKAHIKAYEASLAQRNMYFGVIVLLFLSCLVCRLSCRKRSRKSLDADAP